MACCFPSILDAVFIFWLAYRRATAGAFITIAGFLAWALVFVVGAVDECLSAQRPHRSEVWNLPKYVVAVGMILLLLEDQIEHNKYLALHDELTGLPTAGFSTTASALPWNARADGSQAALLVVDLDQFKQVNDTLGHHAGDQLLQLVGSIFTSRVRHPDTVARTGGDEFSIILEDTGNAVYAHQVADFLMQLLNEPLRVDRSERAGRRQHRGCRVPEDATDMEALCIAADLRMYDDKHDAKGAASAARSGRRSHQSDFDRPDIGATSHRSRSA